MSTNPSLMSRTFLNVACCINQRSGVLHQTQPVVPTSEVMGFFKHGSSNQMGEGRSLQHRSRAAESSCVSFPISCTASLTFFVADFNHNIIIRLVSAVRTACAHQTSRIPTRPHNLLVDIRISGYRAGWTSPWPTNLQIGHLTAGITIAALTMAGLCKVFASPLDLAPQQVLLTLYSTFHDQIYPRPCPAARQSFRQIPDIVPW